jgi:hypothetical protein
MHLLLFLTKEAIFLIPELIDKVVCAELLDLSWDPTGKLIDIVTSQMSHRLYSIDYLNSLYMVCKTLIVLLKCQKRFLKVFVATTIVYKDRYPEYCQHNNSRTFTVYRPGFLDQEVICNNCWVVLYNLYLL